MHSRFVILKALADGGYSQLFRARDGVSGGDVVLKKVKPATAKSADQMRTEIHVLQQLPKHQGIADIIAHGVDETGPWMAREWVEGETLDSRLERGHITQSECIHLLKQLLPAVCAVHKAGFIHGDLSAANVMMAQDGSVKLIDFGNALLADAEGHQMTGSVYHMAPELFDYLPPDVRTDLYAIGVLAYHAVSGRYPFPGDDQHQVITAHHRFRPSPLAGVSPEFGGWVMRLVARHPADRPGTAEEAYEALVKLARAGHDI